MIVLNEGEQYFRELAEELFAINTVLESENKVLKSTLETAIKLWQETKVEVEQLRGISQIVKM